MGAAGPGTHAPALQHHQVEGAPKRVFAASVVEALVEDGHPHLSGRTQREQRGAAGLRVVSAGGHTGTMLVVFLCIMCLFITAVFSVVLCMRKVR